MPLLLLAIPAVAGGWWFANKQLEQTEDLVVKGLVISAVAYLAWTQRAAIARILK